MPQERPDPKVLVAMVVVEAMMAVTLVLFTECYDKEETECLCFREMQKMTGAYMIVDGVGIGVVAFVDVSENDGDSTCRVLNK